MIKMNYPNPDNDEQTKINLLHQQQQSLTAYSKHYLKINITL